jgi:hypothetical protein
MSAEQPNQGSAKAVLVPAPTAWPFTMAVGTGLILFGLLSSSAISVLGAILAVFGAVGWFREVLPHEHEEIVRVPVEEPVPVRPPRTVERLEVAKEIPRAYLPLRTYPVSAGVKGGLAGGVVMAILAMLYGIVAYHSVWYPVNLLAGTLYARNAMPSTEAMLNFNFGWFVFALAMHIMMCLLVGLLYGAMLPMLPRRPILLGGLIGPLLWTGLLYEIIGYVNPLLDERINWLWFAISQVGFGIVAGIVVTRHTSILTTENIPLAMRAGIEAPGLMKEREDEDKH